MANYRVDPKEYERRFNDMHSDKYELVSVYTRNDQPVTIRCRQCGNTFVRASANSVTSRQFRLTCPYCEPKKVTNITIRGVDDLWTTDPDIASYLLNPEDGYKHGRGSGVYVDFKCPECGKVVNKSIGAVVRGGFSCSYCGDGYSYPLKFAIHLLERSGLEFKPEFSFPNTPYRYDYWFYRDGQNYLLELDGSYGHGCQDTKDLTIEEQIAIDREKDKLAKDNGYRIIRVDCKYPNSNPGFRFHYVVSHLRDSEASFLLDGISNQELSDIDVHCTHYSVFLDFVDIWNNGERSYSYIKDKLHITQHTILNYAKRAIDLNLIDVDYETFCKTMSRKGWDEMARKMSIPVMCNETGWVFPSMKAAAEAGYYNVSYQISGQRSYAGKLPDGTQLTWRTITQEEYLKYAS